MSSLCIDFLIRQKVSTNLNYFFIESLPVPREKVRNVYWNTIIARATRLFCCDKEFASLWEKPFSNDWNSADFWYPFAAPIDTYGPVHEQEIRKRICDEARELKPEWAPHCGVHDRLPADVNGDCVVNILDLLYVRNRLGMDPASGDNRRADINRDGVINILDLLLVRNGLQTGC